MRRPPAGWRAAGGVLLVLSLLGSVSSADAHPVTDRATRDCQVTGARTTGDRPADTAPVPAALARVLQDRIDSRGARAEAADAVPIQVPVRVHVIRGKHAADRYATRAQVRETVAVLDDAYAAGQSTTSAPTSVSFALASTDVTRNDAWYHARPMSRKDRRMRRALHLGGAGDLNLYLVRPPSTTLGPLLGYSTFPWQQASSPRLDGVSINVGSLPGGSLRRYNLGDTTVHEAGHWLGLFHTFQGGCQEFNGGDLIADTPAEGEPAQGCPPDSSDTCPSKPGTDPIHNFMDYAFDACMFEFTPGQTTAMHAIWARYRAS